MGIKGLNKLLMEHCPAALRSSEIKNFGGRKVAIDASMSLYQFVIAVRQADGQQLTNENGETTSHLMGMFYRTLRMVDNGIKPVYVFDGKPPVLKSGELAKRKERREEALKKIEELKQQVEDGEEGEETKEAQEDVTRFEKRTVRVTPEQNDEAKKLLTLMGIPIVEAPCEAEAQCAKLAEAGKVYAAASEDMDTLCFGSPVLLRHLTFSEAKKMPISEINFAKILEGLEMTHAQFIDLCILLGCDYADTIRGVGPQTALKLMKEHGSLEKIVEHIEKNPSGKLKVPESWPYQEVRALLQAPDVLDSSSCDIKWNNPDVEGLVDFLVRDKGFSEDRVRAGAARLMKQVKVKPQARLDGFFKVMPKEGGEKRKADDKKTKGKKPATKKAKK
ncbi:flap endonuclease 1 [Yarrowia lipolytica]|uniref:Flap endonuclease 1 n=1 Tax=Yarrowia lipolytica TaxID=4952 RepID=A0A371BY27_YARLL|nr:flap endonuclease 1 [Yarrowia lipolytica]